MMFAQARTVIHALCAHLDLDPTTIEAIDIQLRPNDLVRVHVSLFPPASDTERVIGDLVTQPDLAVEIADGAA